MIFKDSSITKFWKLLSILCCLVLFGSILILDPYWGLMDDHQILSTILPKIEEMGFFPYLWKFSREDLGWGMFRPLYPFMILFLYFPAKIFGPVSLYLLNGIFSILVLGLLAKAFSQLTKLSPWLIFLSFFIFPYTYDLFQHPSLQEKLVHLIGAVFLLMLMRNSSFRNPWLWLVLFLSLGSKTSFLIYLAMGIWIVFWNSNSPLSKRSISCLPLLIFTILATAFYGWVGAQGFYTSSGYSVGKILPTLKSMSGIFFIGLFFILLPPTLYLLKVRKIEPKECASLVGIAAFIAIFLPWGFSGYLLSLLSPFLCVSLLLLFFRAPKMLALQNLARFCLPIFALLVCALRSGEMFLRLSDLKIALTTIAKSEEIKSVEMPCIEGKDAVRYYLKRDFSREIPVLQISEYGNSNYFEGKYLLFDRKLCKIPNEVEELAKCQKNSFYSGRGYKSFELLGLSNCQI
jgi:hypothetical protein